MSRVLLYLLGNLFLLYVHSETLERISRGQAANEGQFPYIVGLALERNDRCFFCGGTIIANDWILTAARCTKGVSLVIIYYGSTQYREAPVTVEVYAPGNIIQHPKFEESNVIKNDISLIRTAWVDFTPYIQSIALPKPDQRGEQLVGQWYTAMGWGKTNSAVTADRLQWVSLEVISSSLCRYYYGKIPAGVMCMSTEETKQSICKGDFGGPLVHEKDKILIGISSFVPHNGCEAGYPAGFARVSEYLDWIRENTGVTS
ncbi:serine protease 3-like [Drosophila tropicalis]|uniref:serine protease 3-like n=1 Tax=Drosophila tropicalis TaxID=46794 RepID=UPI0035AC1B30